MTSLRFVLFTYIACMLMSCSGGDSHDAETPRVLSLSDTNVERKTNYVNWCVCTTDFPYTGTHEYFIFNEQKVVLEVLIEEHQVEGQRVVDVGGEPRWSTQLILHVFAQDDLGSLASWVNNQYSDVLQGGEAQRLEVKTLDAHALSVVSHGFLRQDDNYPHYDIYRVDYFVDNTAELGISIASFSSAFDVAVVARNIASQR